MPVKYYLLICEIGPIADFVTHSRKTIDFWGASFIFSYIMAEIVKKIKEIKSDIIFLPYLDDNPMVTGKGKIVAGSVPDQLYILLNSDYKEKVITILKNAIPDIANDLANKIKTELKINLTPENIKEIESFFNFFYIIHEIKEERPSYNEFIEAERKIKIRACLRKYDQNNGVGINKWKKCSLCGDREEIKEVDTDKIGYYVKEHLCSVCVIKRNLHECLNNKNIVNPQYKSTSDFAAIPILKQIVTINNFFKSDNIVNLLNKLSITYQTLNYCPVSHYFN